MSERKPGWYWVKVHLDAPWEAVQCLGGDAWRNNVRPTKIGTRIPTPDEPWQCVPVEATQGYLAGDKGCVEIWNDAMSDGEGYA